MALKTLDLYKGIEGRIKIQIQYESSTLDVVAVLIQNLSKFFVEFEVFNPSTRSSHTKIRIDPSTRIGTKLSMTGLRLESIENGGFRLANSFSYRVKRSRISFDER
jgi:intein-encoded DNA endonuclease-like protein